MKRPLQDTFGLIVVGPLLLSIAPACDDPPDPALVSRSSELNFGADDRKEPFSLGINEQTQAQADVLINRAGSFTDLGNGTSRITTFSYVDTGDPNQLLCTSEPFFGQPIAGHCSGFLVAPDIVATAHHCVDNLSVGQDPQMMFTFMYRMDGTQARTVLPNSDIYSSVSILSTGLSGTDVALVRLNRIAANRRIVPLRRSGVPSGGTASVMIGHPRGIPQKYVGGAVVKGTTSLALTTTSTTFRGTRVRWSSTPARDSSTGS